MEILYQQKRLGLELTGVKNFQEMNKLKFVTDILDLTT